MEKAKFPMPTMAITQGYNVGTHKGAYALDMAGEDAGIDWVLAPFTGTIKQVLSDTYGNWYWFESNEEVLCANGEITKLTAMFGHDNKIRHNVGDVIKQGEHLCAEGTSGNAIGNHCHFELGKGSYVGTWYPNQCGVYMIYNAVKPNEYLCVPDNYVIKNNGGYNWKKESEVNEPKKYFKYRGQVEDYGWLDWKNEGETCGTTGEAKRLEAIQIDTDLEVQAKAHIQDIGWVDYGTINKDTVIGTVGEWRRLECICLKGDFKYRVHIEGSGWTSWTLADGITTMGTVGQSLRMEAIEIKRN